MTTADIPWADNRGTRCNAPILEWVRCNAPILEWVRCNAPILEWARCYAPIQERSCPAPILAKLPTVDAITVEVPCTDTGVRVRCNAPILAELAVDAILEWSSKNVSTRGVAGEDLRQISTKTSRRSREIIKILNLDVTVADVIPNKRVAPPISTKQAPSLIY